MDDRRDTESTLDRLRASYRSAPTHEERRVLRELQRRRRTRIGVIVGAAVLVVAVGTVAGFILLPHATPEAGSTSTPTATPAPPADEAGPPEITLVGGDLLAEPPAGVSITIPGNVVIAATKVGEQSGYTAYGLVGDANKVCLLVEHDGVSTGDCVTYEEFEQGGVTLDRVDWHVRWWADGRIEWVGI